MKFREFKVLGERCSGTNHAKALIEKNLPLVERTDCCWKHGIANQDVFTAHRDLLFVLVVRNLPDWVRSLHLTPHHLAPELRGLPLWDFMRHEVRSVVDLSSNVSPLDPMFGSPLVLGTYPFSKESSPEGPFGNLLQLRNFKHHAWLTALSEMPKWLLLRHEDLLAQPEQCLRQIAEVVKISPPKQIEPIKAYKGYRFMGEFKPQSYAPFTEEEASFMLAQLDAGLESRLGYDAVADLRQATKRLESAADIAEFQESRQRHTERQLAEMRNYLMSIFAEYEKARAMVPQKASKLRSWWGRGVARH